MESNERSNLYEDRIVLKPYALVDCLVQSTISSKVLEYLDKNTNLLTETKLELWNKIDTVALLKVVPEIAEFYNTIGLKIREVSITVWSTYKDVGLHIDELPVTAKINFPILNTANTVNEWYSVPQELLDTVEPKVNQFGAKYYDLGSIDLNMCSKIDEIEVLQPIVFNSQVPHKIRITKQAQFPRIVMPCTFFKQPISFLEN